MEAVSYGRSDGSRAEQCGPADLAPPPQNSGGRALPSDQHSYWALALLMTAGISTSSASARWAAFSRYS